MVTHTVYSKERNYLFDFFFLFERIKSKKGVETIIRKEYHSLKKYLSNIMALAFCLAEVRNLLFLEDNEIIFLSSAVERFKYIFVNVPVWHCYAQERNTVSFTEERNC